MANIKQIEIQENEYDICDINGRNLIAPEFITENTYNEDDYVIYNNELYRYKNSTSTSGAWVESRWEKITDSNLAKKINNNIEKVEAIKNSLTNETGTIKLYNSLSQEINDALELPLKNMKIYGKTIRSTNNYTGKQCFYTDNSTIMYENGSNPGYRVRGTSLNLRKNASRLFGYVYLEPNTTYDINGFFQSNYLYYTIPNTSINFSFPTTNSNSLPASSSQAMPGKGLKIQVPSGLSANNYPIYINAVQEVNYSLNAAYFILFYKDSNISNLNNTSSVLATNWEPYIGGEPQPNFYKSWPIQTLSSFSISNSKKTLNLSVGSLNLYGIPAGSYSGNTWNETVGSNTTIWISDILNLEEEKIYKIISKETFAGGEDESWQIYSGNNNNEYNLFYISGKMSDAKPFSLSSTLLNGTTPSLCNYGEYLWGDYNLSGNNIEEEIYNLLNEKQYIYFKDNDIITFYIKLKCSDINTLKTKLNNNPIEIYYLLDTEQIINLNAEQLALFDKFNNFKMVNNGSIWHSDNCALELTYYKNYYNKIKELEAFVDALIYDRSNGSQKTDHGIFITNQPVSDTITGTAEIKVLGYADPYNPLTFTWKREGGMGWVDLDANEYAEDLKDSNNITYGSRITTNRTTSSVYVCFVSIGSSTPVESRPIYLRKQI